MKASYNWLKGFCDFDLPAHELADRLGQVGLNVEGFEPVGQDWSLDIEVTSNRPDCLCHLGIAREIAAIVGGRAVRPEMDLRCDGRGRFADHSSVEVTAPDLCPHYTARLIRGVRVGASPGWLRRRLEACGVRPINNVVDATNYVMLECGQPLHAFDFSLLRGGRIVVRRAEPGEVIVTIDGAEHELTGEECVIADAERPVALGGVMGGLDSEIGDRTSDILLEAARFQAVSIRRTSRRHAVASESSYRYERGVDPEITDWASRRVCALIAELAGGTVLDGVAAVRADHAETPEVTLRLPRLTLVLGIAIPRQEVLRVFGGLGLDVLHESADTVTVRVPTWRGDLRAEVDLIEEVARIHGYDRIAETTQMPVRAVAATDGELVERRTRALLAGAGFTEVLTHSLVSPTEWQSAQPWRVGAPLAVTNPFTSDRTHLRLTCMANLLLIKRVNEAHGTADVDLFEMGAAYLPRGEDELPEEKQVLALLTDRPEGLRVLKGVMANLLDELGIQAAAGEEPGCAGPFREDEAVLLWLDGELVGCGGVVSDAAAEGLDLRGRPAVMELDFGLLAGRADLARPARPVPQFPGIRRDLAVVVAEGVLWAEVARCVRAAAPGTLEGVEFMDVYRGEPVPAGYKSVAFGLVFRCDDRTMTAEEAEEGRAAILDALLRELGAQLR